MNASEPIELTPGLPDIALVFEALKGRPLAGEDGQIERRDFCLAHDDTGHPSCDYNVVKNTWHCKTCSENGGVFDLIISNGDAKNKRGALSWLRSKGIMAERPSISRWETVDVSYPYTNASGVLLYEVGRWNLPGGKKDFRQRRPHPNGGDNWIHDLKGVERVPYRLPSVLAAAEAGQTIFVVEGEKDADRLVSLGLTATTNAQGAKWKWPASWAEFFKGASRVVVIGDNDESGIEAAQLRGSIAALAVPDTRMIAPMPAVGPHGDVSNWLEAGGTVSQLLELSEAAPVVQPYHIGYPETAVYPLVCDMTDTGNTEWLVSCVGEDLLYVPEYKAWLGWDGTRWIPGIMPQKLVKIALNMMKSAAQNYTGRDADEFREWAELSRSNSKRQAMLECAKSERCANANELDAYRSLLNVQNGILDCETGQLLPHSQKFLMTKIAKISYDPDAVCPNWEKWIEEAMEGDKERIDYIQQIMGGMLVGRPGTRRLFFAYGPPGTGKSTITNVMHALLGDYAVSIDFNVIAQRTSGFSSGPSPELARLKGMRLITAVESRDNDRLDAAKLKQFVGGDMITARHLNQDMIEFAIEGTLFMSGNSRPIIDADESLWSKLKLIPFEKQFEEQNLNFYSEFLEPELPGILGWAVNGLRPLIENNYQLLEPKAVREATADYRNSENRLSAFIEECCELFTSAPSGSDRDKWRVSPSDLRLGYRWWYEKEHIHHPLGERAFANQLKHIRGVEHYKSNGARFWRGIRLNPETANKLMQADQRPRNSPPQRDQDVEHGDF